MLKTEFFQKKLFAPKKGGYKGSTKIIAKSTKKRNNAGNITITPKYS